PGQPRELRGLERRGPRAHAGDAGGLRVVRHPRERAAPGHDPHAVRREVLTRVVPEPRGWPQGDPQAPAHRRARQARGRGVRGAVPRLRRVALCHGERALCRRRRARREVTATPGLATAALALSAIATPALARVRTASGETHLALWRDGRLRDLRPLTLDGLLHLPRHEMRALLEADPSDWREIDRAAVALAAPVESQEVWAAGVTYIRSREARLEA